MKPAPFDLPQAHRWFAVELNNRAWDLVEADTISDTDRERMIHAAHAACHHWLEVGDALNHLRAQCLLATAYVRAGLPGAAVRHAETCLALSHEAGDAQTAFDRATAHGCAAAAYKIAGRDIDAQSQYERAEAAVAVFDDPADEDAFRKLYPAPVR